MSKSKSGTAKTVVGMIFLAVIIIGAFWYVINRTEKDTTSKVQSSTEIEQILQKDFEQNYPATPRDVVKAYSRMLKCLYSGLTEDEIKQLGMKMRMLYAKDFKDNNPETEYIESLLTETELYKELGKSMLSYEVEKSSLVKYETVNSYELANLNVEFSMKAGANITRTTEKVYLVQEDSKWKIYGWKIITDEQVEAD